MTNEFNFDVKHKDYKEWLNQIEQVSDADCSLLSDPNPYTKCVCSPESSERCCCKDGCQRKYPCSQYLCILDTAEKATICLDEGFENAMTVMYLPKGMRRFFRTSNQIERFIKELKRRSNVIGIFSNEASLVRLIGSVLIDQNDICQSGRAVFSKESYRKLMSTDVLATFHRIALEQTAFLAA